MSRQVRVTYSLEDMRGVWWRRRNDPELISKPGSISSLDIKPDIKPDVKIFKIEAPNSPVDLKLSPISGSADIKLKPSSIDISGLSGQSPQGSPGSSNVTLPMEPLGCWSVGNFHPVLPRDVAFIGTNPIAPPEDSKGFWSHEDPPLFEMNHCVNIMFDNLLLHCPTARASGRRVTNSYGKNNFILSLTSSIMEVLIAGSMPGKTPKIALQLPTSSIKHCRVVGAGSNCLNFIFFTLDLDRKYTLSDQGFLTLRNKLIHIGARPLTLDSSEEKLIDTRVLRICTNGLGARRLSILETILGKEKLELDYAVSSLPAQVPGKQGQVRKFEFRCSSISFGSLAYKGPISASIKLGGFPLRPLISIRAERRKHRPAFGKIIRHHTEFEYIVAPYNVKSWILFVQPRGYSQLARELAREIPYHKLETRFDPMSEDQSMAYMALAVDAKSLEDRKSDLKKLLPIFENVKHFRLSQWDSKRLEIPGKVFEKSLENLLKF